MRIKSIITIFIITALCHNVYAQIPQKSTIKTHQFVVKPFNNEITSAFLINNYWWRKRVHKEPVKNPHNNQVDTIINVKIGQSEFRFYKTPNRELFFYADVRNRRIKPNYNVHIGMHKEELKHLFVDVQAITENPSVITDSNQLSKCSLHFRRNRLKRIIIEYYID